MLLLSIASYGKTPFSALKSFKMSSDLILSINSYKSLVEEFTSLDIAKDWIKPGLSVAFWANS